MKVARSKVVELMESHDLAVSKKGKPFSNEKLLEALVEGLDSMSDEEGNFEDDLAAALSTAFDDEEEIELTGEDPTVPRKGNGVEKNGKTKPAEAKKGKKKPAPEPEDEEEEDEEEEEAPKKNGKGKKKADKPAKKKKESVRDEWNSNPASSAGRINAVFFSNKKKPMTVDDVYTALDDEEVSRQRVRDHLRRLHQDEIVLKDAKDRYTINKSRPVKEEAEEE